MKRIFLFIVILSGTVVAQDNRIAQFTIWEPKETQAFSFQRGYQKHLQWHKAAGDPWEWYGWYFTSGPRIGHFVEATFNHSWSDFDNPIDPAEDQADILSNIDQFGYMRLRFKAYFLKDQSIANSGSLRSKMLRMVTVNVTDTPGGVKIVDRYKSSFRSNSDITTLMAFKVIDGGNANQLLLLIGSNSWEQYGKTENIQDQLANIENALKIKGTVKSVSSETLTYQPDMSLAPE